MKSHNALPFTTENHEYYISWDKTTATIKCKFQNEDEAFSNPISLDEFKEMVYTAATAGIKEVCFNSNYSIQVHSYTWKEYAKELNIKLTKINE